MRYILFILFFTNYGCSVNNNSVKKKPDPKQEDFDDTTKNAELSKTNVISRRDSLLELLSQKFSKNENGYHFFDNNDEYALITDKAKLDNRSIVFFDKDSIGISSVFDLKGNNPFREYLEEKKMTSGHHQISGYTVEKEENLTDMGIPEQLKSIIPGNFNFSYAQYSNNTFQNSTDGLIVSYQFSLLPTDEILEGLAIPAVSILKVINSYGQVVGISEEMPYYVEDVLFSANEKYLVFIHQNNYASYSFQIDEEFNSDNCISILEVHSNRIIYQKCNQGMLFIDKSKDGIINCDAYDKKSVLGAYDFTHYVLNDVRGVLNIFDNLKSFPEGVYEYYEDRFVIRNNGIALKTILFDDDLVRKKLLKNEN